MVDCGVKAVGLRAVCEGCPLLSELHTDLLACLFWALNPAKRLHTLFIEWADEKRECEEVFYAYPLSPEDTTLHVPSVTKVDISSRFEAHIKVTAEDMEGLLLCCLSLQRLTLIGLELPSTTLSLFATHPEDLERFAFLNCTGHFLSTDELRDLVTYHPNYSGARKTLSGRHWGVGMLQSCVAPIGTTLTQTEGQATAGEKSALPLTEEQVRAYDYATIPDLLRVWGLSEFINAAEDVTE